MSTPNPTTERKLAEYRVLYKKQLRKTDKDFDALLKTLGDPEKAASYLRGYLSVR